MKKINEWKEDVNKFMKDNFGIKKRCLFCGKDISNMHKNAKFCSNKRYNNCKDNFNNAKREKLLQDEFLFNYYFDYDNSLEYLSACGDK